MPNREKFQCQHYNFSLAVTLHFDSSAEFFLRAVSALEIWLKVFSCSCKDYIIIFTGNALYFSMPIRSIICDKIHRKLESIRKPGE